MTEEDWKPSDVKTQFDTMRMMIGDQKTPIHTAGSLEHGDTRTLELGSKLAFMLHKLFLKYNFYKIYVFPEEHIFFAIYRSELSLYCKKRDQRSAL